MCHFTSTENLAHYFKIINYSWEDWFLLVKKCFEIKHSLIQAFIENIVHSTTLHFIYLWQPLKNNTLYYCNTAAIVLFMSDILPSSLELLLWWVTWSLKGFQFFCIHFATFIFIWWSFISVRELRIFLYILKVMSLILFFRTNST